MKIYVPNIDKSYQDTIIGNLKNSETLYSLPQMVYCWRTCEVNKEKRALPMVMYCYGMIYKYFLVLVF